MPSPKTFSEKVNFFSNLYLKKNSQTVPQEFLPTDLDEAYKIQTQLIANSQDSYQHFKLGGTNQKTRDIFKVTKPYFGMIANHNCQQVTNNKQNICLGKQTENLLAELEIIIRISQNIDIKQNINATNLTQYIGSYTFGLELPQNYLDNLELVGVSGLVAENCAAGYLIYGEFQPYKNNSFNLSDKFIFYQDDSKIAEGVYQNLIGGLEKTLLEFIQEAQKHNFTITANSLIATGGLTDCVPIDRNKTIKLVGPQFVQSFIIN